MRKGGREGGREGGSIKNALLLLFWSKYPQKDRGKGDKIGTGYCRLVCQGNNIGIV